MATRLITSVVDSGTGVGTLGLAANSIANDLLIAFIERSYADTNQSAPSGWTQFSFSPINDGSGSQFQAFWRRANDTATDDFAVTDGGNHFRAVGLVIREASLGTNPFDFVTSGSKTTASTSVTITGGTTTVNDCYIISAFTTPLDSNAEPSSNWANSSLVSITGSSLGGTNAGDGGSVSYAFGRKATAGAVSNTTATVTSSTNAWCMIAIRPSVAMTAEPAEPANRIVAPFDLSNASWTNFNSSETVNSTTAPDGTTTADTLVAATISVATANRPIISASGSQVSGTTYDFSAWAKPGGSTRFGLALNGTFYAHFDLTGSGTASHSDTWAGGTINSSSITKVGDWYWCRLNYTADTSNSITRSCYIPIGTSNSSSDAGNTVTFDPSSTVYIWGVSWVQGTAPSVWPFGSHQITANDADLFVGFPPGPSNYSLTANSGSFSVTGIAASVVRSAVVLSEVGSFAITGNDAIIEKQGGLNNYVLTASAGSLSIQGQDANLSRGINISASAGVFSIQRQDASLLKTANVIANAGTFSVQGENVNILRALRIGASAGSFSVVGQVANLLRSYNFISEAGVFVITGNDTFDVNSRLISANAGQFIISGQSADIIRTIGLTAEAEIYSLVGNSAEILISRSLLGSAGSYVITGNDANLNKAFRRRVFIIT